MIDFEQELYNHFGQVKDFTLGMRIGKYFYELGCRRTAEKYDEIEYNRQRVEESGGSEIPKDLKEAAEDFVWEVMENDEDGISDLCRKLRPTSKISDFYDALAEFFIAGAKWQAEHTPLPEDTVLFNKGVEEGKRLAEEELSDLLTIAHLQGADQMKEQMLKDAVEGEVVKDISNKLAVTAKINLDGFKFGDKVRIIIVQED